MKAAASKISSVIMETSNPSDLKALRAKATNPHGIERILASPRDEDKGHHLSVNSAEAFLRHLHKPWNSSLLYSVGQSSELAPSTASSSPGNYRSLSKGGLNFVK